MDAPPTQLQRVQTLLNAERHAAFQMLPTLFRVGHGSSQHQRAPVPNRHEADKHGQFLSGLSGHAHNGKLTVGHSLAVLQHGVRGLPLEILSSISQNEIR